MMNYQTSRHVVILGVEIKNCSTQEAIHDFINFFNVWPVRSHGIYIVNAHTLNLVYENSNYRNVIVSGDIVLADGTGVRWAARMRGVLMKDNLVGTDLIPQLFARTSGRGYRYFLLGSTEETIRQAADYSVATHPGWTMAGFHHGYLNADNTEQVITAINGSNAQLLLVGMGNPIQELWIHDHLHELRVPVCIGVGGLFDHWGGNLKRASPWVRRLGYEWLQILLQQPNKWKRYILGNPKYLVRIVRELPRDRSLREKLENLHHNDYAKIN